jgi:hypothetical protein
VWASERTRVFGEVPAEEIIGQAGPAALDVDDDSSAWPDVKRPRAGRAIRRRSHDAIGAGSTGDRHGLGVVEDSGVSRPLCRPRQR